MIGAAAARRSRARAAKKPSFARVASYRPRGRTVAAARRQAALAASAREDELTGRCATGEERRGAPGCRGAPTSAISRPRRGGSPRPHRARERLVAIYESGTPSTASVILASGSFDELAHPHRIPASGSSSPTPTWPAGSPRFAAPSPRRSKRHRRPRRPRSTLTTSASPRPAPKSPACAQRPKRPPPQLRLPSPPHRVRLAGDAEIEDRQLGKRHRGGRSREPRRSRNHASSAGSAAPTRSPPTCHVRVRRQLRRPRPFERRRRRLPNPPLDWEPYGGQGAPHEPPKAEQDAHRRRNLGRLAASSAWVLHRLLDLGG